MRGYVTAAAVPWGSVLVRLDIRLDLGLENALNKQYALPLGGAYIGQGTTMSLNGAGAPYGVVVPGMGRSLYAGVNVSF